MNFREQIFSAIYHPQGEKVSLALAHWEHGRHGEIVKELRRISNGFSVEVLSG